jgi:hypothetical protein
MTQLPDKIPGMKRGIPKPESVGVVPSRHIPPEHQPTPETITAAAARDVLKAVARVAEEVNPLAVDYGQTAYDADAQRVLWIAGDGTSEDEAAQARAAFLAIDGVDDFDHEHEGMPDGWCGAEQVYGSAIFSKACEEQAEMAKIVALAAQPLDW